MEPNASSLLLNIQTYGNDDITLYAKSRAEINVFLRKLCAKMHAIMHDFCAKKRA